MIKLLYFAIIREKLGKQEESLNFSGSVGELREKLMEMYPHLRDIIEVSLFAVNHEYVGDDFQLQEGGKVAVIPPVSGG